MVKFLSIVLAFTLMAVGFTSGRCHAAGVGFVGTLTTYSAFTGPSDPLGLGLAEAFTAKFDTAGSTITGGSIVFTSGSGKSFNFGSGGTVTIGAGTTDFTGINLLGPTGGTIQFSFSTALANLTDSAYSVLAGTTAGVAIGGGFLSPAANGFYSGSAIAAVPEPTTTAALFGLVLGFGGLEWRRRRKSLAKPTAGIEA